ncbi:secreted protein [Streptomyces bingchenggensis BCW-1]|uniref:Secreted protein n=1 Tax=Streptomyces bingchenggensis (strain BCW-1) TaxID=749414 RepID=D7BUL5_STRBB|nr:SPFH domain-containing protein [Streptomyces bingchenggensis]ADI03206.1 secreted protein [Streptomyces bingchenggensis BCW-1]
MVPIIIVLIILVVLVFITLIKTIQVIPQASAAIVERFGRYTRTLNAGLNIVVPFIDSIRNRVDLREQVVPFPPQPVTTQDNLVVSTDTVIYYQVTDARAATYEVASYIQAIEQLTVTTLRNIIGGMDLERTLTSREEINAALRGVLDEATGKWGIRVNRAELKAIEPPTSIQGSVERQMRADRDKRAAILQAEGEKQAALLKAETEREVAAILAGGSGATRSTPQSPVRASPVPGHQPLLQDDPRRIGRYHLTARLGQGGMGTVYLGRSPGQRLVAVKAIRPEFAADPTFRERFAREIDAARRVGGFHTAPVVDADSRGDLPWLATEYIPGPSLHDVLRQQGALPTRTLLTLAVGIAEALEGIHACGIIHRDLKPSNIIVSSTGPRVIDFGIARALDSTALTRTNHVVGTQGFLAPEQLTGTSITPAADLYAFGMVLCHAAGATPLTDGESLESALSLLPARFVGIITRCLDHNPNGRPTPTEVLEQLSQNDSPTEDWLPPPVRTMVDLHNAPTAAEPGR